MFVIGITGPSGAGKGEASKYLRTKGFGVIDADAVYHDVIAPPSDCLDELVRNFGRAILTGLGFLNRKALAGMVFGEENRQNLELLNKITHKYVVEKIRKILLGLSAAGMDVCVIDAPLLIEAGLVPSCDLTLAVLADEDTRAERISARDSIGRDAALARIRSQKPDGFYRENTDAAVYNDGDLNTLASSLDNLLRERGVGL